MDSPRAPDFPALLARLAGALQRRNVGFMLIGGQAVLVHGRPRLTEDIDITLAAGPGELSTILEVCRELRLEPLPEDIDGFVRETFVLPALDPETAVRVDFIFSSIPYEREAIQRAELIEIEGTPVPFATAEDLLLHKLFAGRPRDIEDAAGVVRRKGDDLDWDYLERWAREFAAVPGREDLPERLRQLRELD